MIRTLKAFPGRALQQHLPAPTEEYYEDEEDGEDDFFEDYLGNMLGGFGSSIRTAEAPDNDNNRNLLCNIDPLAMQTVHLPPIPAIKSPAAKEMDTSPEDTTIMVPIICQIQSQQTTDAQADSGANRAITDNLSVLHHTRQMLKPYPVGSIDWANKLYCTAIGELHLRTKEGRIEQFPCLYSAQSAGTVISPDNKCTTSTHLTQWEQVGDTVTERGAIRFRNQEEDIVATLPTYRKNGLWYTELAAIPADDTATARIHTLKALAHGIEPRYDDIGMALTDSDRHHVHPLNLGGGAHFRTKLTTSLQYANPPSSRQ